ncbi:MAG TPA: NAD-dependent epimerase/dehydratase family protein [Alphaproteobacteria bacterium]|nr:NAD-dependent epimerase/dehydratase family protein [Alphaproteobacteria bacterium]
MTRAKMGEIFVGRRCLVTGGAGSIGSQLVRDLVSMRAHVTVLDNFSSGNIENLTEVLPKITLIRGSVSVAQDLKAAFAAGPNYVFHLAAHFANQNSIEHPYSDMTTNAVGTQMLLDCARANPDLRGLVYASSSCVLGVQSETMHEELRPEPETPYGVSKLCGEHYTLVYAQVYKLPASVVRYFNVFGPGERPGRYRNVIPNFMHKAMHGEPLTITGSGDESREFVYVSDASAGTMLAAITPAARGQVFHLGSGQVIPIKQLAENIVALSGGRSRLEFKPRRAWDGISRRQTSSEKAKRVLGYETNVSFQDGLHKTWSWMTACETAVGCLDPDVKPVVAMPASIRRYAAAGGD